MNLYDPVTTLALLPQDGEGKITRDNTNTPFQGINGLVQSMVGKKRTYWRDAIIQPEGVIRHEYVAIVNDRITSAFTAFLFRFSFAVP